MDKSRYVEQLEELIVTSQKWGERPSNTAQWNHNYLEAIVVAAGDVKHIKKFCTIFCFSTVRQIRIATASNDQYNINSFFNKNTFILPTFTAHPLYTNIRKARWEDFVSETEEKYSNEPPPTSYSADKAGVRNILFPNLMQ